MAKSQTSDPKPVGTKLARLPTHLKVEKRPLLRHAIPSPYSGSKNPKVVYVGCKTPFVSALKRVKQLLRHADERATQSDLALTKKSGQRKSAPIRQSAKTESVFLKGTGKSIDKVLNLALKLRNQGDLHVKIRTGSVIAVDDIIDDRDSQMKTAATGNTPTPDVINNPDNNEYPESRVRQTSMVEVEIISR